MAAIGTPLFAVQFAEKHPDARVVQLADSAGGYQSDTDEFEEIFRTWGTQELLAAFPELGYEAEKAYSPLDFYLAGPALQGRVQFSQYNSAADANQVFFSRLAGISGRYLIERIDANHTVIEAALPTFVTFTAPGEGSDILWSDDFYSLVIDGASFQRWVAALAEGERVGSVRCRECVAPDRVP
jgi:hypothetical protein